MKAAHTQRAVPQTEHEADPPDVQDAPAKYVQVGEFRGRLRFHLERKAPFVLGSPRNPKAVIVPMVPHWIQGIRERERWAAETAGQVKALFRECNHG
jgi:hypothetical protein